MALNSPNSIVTGMNHHAQLWWKFLSKSPGSQVKYQVDLYIELEATKDTMIKTLSKNKNLGLGI